MNKCKKWIALLLTLLLSIGLFAGCGGTAEQGSEPGSPAQAEDGNTAAEPTVIKMGSSGIYTNMVDIIASLMPAEYKVELVTFDSNTGGVEGATYGDIDCFMYNHEPWIKQYNEKNGTDFVMLNHLYYGRTALYSNRWEKLEDLPDGASIAIANDSVNMENNLLFLESLGLIKMGEKTDSESFLTTLDVVENPHNIQFVEVEISYAVRSIEECDATVCTATSILQAGLDPEKFLAENYSKKDYPIGLTMLAEKENEPWVSVMLDVLASDEFKTQFNEAYQGSLVLY